jgi:hypothetical protein
LSPFDRKVGRGLNVFTNRHRPPPRSRPRSRELEIKNLKIEDEDENDDEEDKMEKIRLPSFQVHLNLGRQD